MTKPRDIRVVLFDIQEAAKRIEEFIKGLDESGFEKNDLVSSAVQHQMLIIGEAAKRVPEEFREKHSNIPWKAMAGMRDILIHQYHHADPKEVWRTAKAEIPGLVQNLKKILESLG